MPTVTSSAFDMLRSQFRLQVASNTINVPKPNLYDLVGEIERTARSLFATDPRVTAFVEDVAEPGRYDVCLRRAWDNDQNGWRYEAIERAEEMLSTPDWGIPPPEGWKDEPLYLYEGGPDWVIAHSPTDARNVWAENIGEDPLDYDSEIWEKMAGDEPVELWMLDGEICEVDGDGADTVTMTATEAVKRFGRGFVASSEY